MGLLSEKQMVMKQSRTFEGWERYPTNLSNYHQSAIDGEALDQQLSSFSERLFCGKGCRIGVDIFEVQGPWSLIAILWDSANIDDFPRPRGNEILPEQILERERLEQSPTAFYCTWHQGYIYSPSKLATTIECYWRNHAQNTHIPWCLSRFADKSLLLRQLYVDL